MKSDVAEDSQAAFPTLREFEDATLDITAFDHEAHVYIAWRLLQECTAAEAIARFSAALRRITDAHNAPAKYNETITWFFVLQINDRMHRDEPQSWTSFAARNRDLLRGAGTLLRRHYSDEYLWSERARRQFLLPDKLPAVRS